MPAPKYDYVKLNITTPDGELLEQTRVYHYNNIPDNAPVELECVGNVACEQELLALIRQYVKWPQEQHT